MYMDPQKYNDTIYDLYSLMHKRKNKEAKDIINSAVNEIQGDIHVCRELQKTLTGFTEGKQKNNIRTNIEEIEKTLHNQAGALRRIGREID